MNTTIKPSYGQPALIGGVVMGVLSALPIVAAGNICCCLWVIAGGVVAAYVLQQNHPMPIESGDGALVGLFAGLIGAAVQVVVSIPINLIAGPMERAMMERMIEMSGSMPPEMRDVFERYSRGEGQSGAFFLVGRVFAFVFWLFIGALFSTIGGLIGAAMFKKSAPPPPPM